MKPRLHRPEIRPLRLEQCESRRMLSASSGGAAEAAAQLDRLVFLAPGAGEGWTTIAADSALVSAFTPGRAQSLGREVVARAADETGLFYDGVGDGDSDGFGGLLLDHGWAEWDGSGFQVSGADADRPRSAWTADPRATPWHDLPDEGDYLGAEGVGSTALGSELGAASGSEASAEHESAGASQAGVVPPRPGVSSPPLHLAPLPDPSSPLERAQPRLVAIERVSLRPAAAAGEGTLGAGTVDLVAVLLSADVDRPAAARAPSDASGEGSTLAGLSATPVESPRDTALAVESWARTLALPDDASGLPDVAAVPGRPVAGARAEVPFPEPTPAEAPEAPLPADQPVSSVRADLSATPPTWDERSKGLYGSVAASLSALLGGVVWVAHRPAGRDELDDRSRPRQLPRRRLREDRA